MDVSSRYVIKLLFKSASTILIMRTCVSNILDKIYNISDFRMMDIYYLTKFAQTIFQLFFLTVGFPSFNPKLTLFLPKMFDGRSKCRSFLCSAATVIN